jgi:carbon storage regulator
MLVIMREVDGTFSIGDDITVQILAIQGNQVRLGIDAPKDVRIHRAEVYRRIAQKLSRRPGKPDAGVPDTRS